MLTFLQANLGSIVVLLVVALIVFLAIRRMVLDKKAGIGACGQKCSQCSKMGHCESEATVKPPIQEGCGGACSSCQYSATCHKG